MRLKLLLSLSVLSISIFSHIATSCAEDDVYIDYSVLNSLQSNSFSAPAQPLFPEVKEEKKAPQKTSVSKSKQSKKKKSLAVKKKKIEEAPEIESKKEEPEQLSEEIKIQEQQKNINTLKAALKQNSEETNTVLPSQNSDKISIPLSVSEEKQPEEINTKQEVDNSPMETKMVNVSLKQNVSENQTAESEMGEDEESKTEENIISKTILFSEDSSELTDKDKTQIDKIIGGFKDIANNKIAITSYNLDDGKEVFYRKKQSLDRAIAVRSYLLGKGYKNYSIKVINIPSGDERVNTVDIFELE